MPVFTSSIEVTADYPTIKPSLNLNFARSRALDPRITFTRASVGTYVGRDGLVKTAGEDEARFDYDPETLESLGLLLEDSRTNLCINSTASSNWGTPFQLTKSASKTITAPSGDIDAYEWTETTDSTTHLNNGPTITITSGSSYSISSFFKKTAGTVDRGYFLQWYKSGGQTVKVTYLPSTDTTSISTSGGASAPTNVSVVTYPNGWYKISFTATLAETSALAIVGLSDASGNTGFTGDTSVKHSFWGLQYEAGAFPTSYIPTSGSNATRARDDATIVGESFNSFYNQNEGSLFVESTPMYLASGINHRVCVITGDSNFTDSNAPGGINVDYDGTTLRTELFGGSPNSAQQGTGLTVSTGTKNKLAYGLETNNVSVIVNGTQVGSTDTSAPMPDPMTKMGIGRRPDISTTYADGIHVSSIQYYPKRLTNAQLQLLTS